jgi:hypothetical protein
MSATAAHTPALVVDGSLDPIDGSVQGQYLWQAGRRSAARSVGTPMKGLAVTLVSETRHDVRSQNTAARANGPVAAS